MICGCPCQLVAPSARHVPALWTPGASPARPDRAMASAAPSAAADCADGPCPCAVYCSACDMWLNGSE
eukprot:6990539-Lingulodinium_polyedra.AAC.1